MPKPIRSNGIEWVKVQLKIAENDGDLLQALQRIDQTIHHLFANEDSPVHQAFHDFSQLQFLIELDSPAAVTQLDTPSPGHDIILILNRKQVTILKNNSPHQETIPAQLKCPEKILAQIIGPNLTKKLLTIRCNLLNQLVQNEESWFYWQVNVAANARALAIIDHDYPKLSNIRWLKALFPHTPNNVNAQNNQPVFGRIHLRNTGIKSVIKILRDIPNHYPKDAIRMLDRTIGGLLAHKESPFYDAYRTYTKELFPAGLEHTVPKKDIILILNSDTATIRKNISKTETIQNNNPQTLEIKIPPQLKHPEKGVGQIVGIQLARQIFKVREDILEWLQSNEPDGSGWHVNVEANRKAREVLKHYDPYHTEAPYHNETWSSWLTQSNPCLPAQENMIGLHALL